MAILDSVSYDQYSDIPSIDELGIKTKVIFDDKTYRELLAMMAKTAKSNNETGIFFVGRRSKEDDMTIYVDYCTSEFENVDGIISGGAVSATEQNYIELQNRLAELKQKGENPVVFHYHTHPKVLFYESYSDQDLEIYARFQKDHPEFTVLGMLGFPAPVNSSTYGVSIVQPTLPTVMNGVVTADFYKYQNIYYCAGNNIYKMGQFDKNYTGRKFKNVNKNLNIVRNVTCNNNPRVSGIGINPNTGTRINDDYVGFVDRNVMYFPHENISYNFPVIPNVSIKPKR